MSSGEFGGAPSILISAGFQTMGSSFTQGLGLRKGKVRGRENLKIFAKMEVSRIMGAL